MKIIRLENKVSLAGLNVSSRYKYGPLYLQVKDGAKSFEECAPRITPYENEEGYHVYKMIPRTGGPSGPLYASKWDCLTFALCFCTCEGWNIVGILED